MANKPKGQTEFQASFSADAESRGALAAAVAAFEDIEQLAACVDAVIFQAQDEEDATAAAYLLEAAGNLSKQLGWASNYAAACIQGRRLENSAAPWLLSPLAAGSLLGADAEAVAAAGKLGAAKGGAA